MPCGTYRYKMNWDCRAGRLKKLNTQIKPNSTRNYGSDDARVRLIRRRTAAKIISNPPPDYNIKGGVNRGSPNTRVGLGSQYNGRQAAGPFFGMKLGPGSGPCACTTAAVNADRQNGKVYRSNGGTGGDVAYWKRVHAGTRLLMPACWGCAPPVQAATSGAEFLKALKCNIGADMGITMVASDTGKSTPVGGPQCLARFFDYVLNGNLDSRGYVRNVVYSFGNFMEAFYQPLGQLGAMNNPGRIEQEFKWPKETITVGPSMRYAGGPQTNAGRYLKAGSRLGPGIPMTQVFN